MCQSVRPPASLPSAFPCALRPTQKWPPPLHGRCHFPPTSDFGPGALTPGGTTIALPGPHGPVPKQRSQAQTLRAGLSHSLVCLVEGTLWRWSPHEREVGHGQPPQRPWRAGRGRPGTRNTPARTPTPHPLPILFPSPPAPTHLVHLIIPELWRPQQGRSARAGGGYQSAGDKRWGRKAVPQSWCPAPARVSALFPPKAFSTPSPTQPEAGVTGTLVTTGQSNMPHAGARDSQLESPAWVSTLSAPKH